MQASQSYFLGTSVNDEVPDQTLETTETNLSIVTTKAHNTTEFIFYQTSDWLIVHDLKEYRKIYYAYHQILIFLLETL